MNYLSVIRKLRGQKLLDETMRAPSLRSANLEQNKHIKK